MVDCFVVLAPLATVPIVLFLVFLGCTLDRAGSTLVALDIAPGCDAAASSITVTFTSFINDETFTTTLTPVPSSGITISTFELEIASDDEGSVWCGVTITPIAGDEFNLPTAGQEKFKSQELDPFTLFCIDGEFELS